MNLLAKIQKYRRAGLSYRQIGRKLKTSYQFAWYVLNGQSKKEYKNCPVCGDSTFGPRYYVRRWNEKRGFRVDEGCALLLDSKGIIDPSFTGIVN